MLIDFLGLFKNATSFAEVKTQWNFSFFVKEYVNKSSILSLLFPYSGSFKYDQW